MNVVHEDVEKLVEKELATATERFGLHHSWHEKYAVMLEELQELREEVNLTDKEIDSIWFGLRNNLPEYAEEHIHYVYEYAVKAACEAIQVAAMCKKKIDERSDKKTAGISDHGTYTGKDDVRVLRCEACKNDFVSTIRPHPYFCPKCGAPFTDVFRF